ncbi:MAG: hypothetical protein HFI86_04815 [Bacilli bacterium]|nr:hypothetical protein [Bacilli bacterium]
MAKKTSKTTKSLIVLCFVLLVSIIGFNVYQKLVNTPKKIFIDAINSLTTDYKYFNNIENINYNFPNNDFTYNGKIDINFISPLIDSLKLEQDYKNIVDMFNILNEVKINYKLQKSNQEILLELNGRIRDNTLDLLYYMDGIDHYIKLMDYSDNYIKISKMIENIKGNFIYIEDNDYLFDFIKNSFINNLANEYFKTVKDEIVINNEKISVSKNILTLDRKNITTILNKVISDLKNDDKAFNILLEIFPDFENFDITIEDNIEDDIVIYFNTYTDNNKLIKYDLEINNISKFMELPIDNIVISFFKNSNIIEIMIDNKKTASIKFYDEEEGYRMEVYLNDSKILTLFVSDKSTNKQVEINSGFLTGNSFNLLLSEILDENILEDYDKLEDRLLFNFNFLGFNMLEFELKSTSNIYDESNIDISIPTSQDLDNFNEFDFQKLKDIILNFIDIKES